MKFIPDSVTRTIARQILVAQKNSPHIMFGAGLIGIVGGTVLACRATLKLGTSLDNMKEDIEAVKELKSTNPEESYNKHMAYVYGKGTLDICKLYAPAVLVGAASIGLLTASHITLTRRNTALTAAYAAVAKAYEEYRARVKSVIGEEKEGDIYNNVSIEAITDGEGKSKDLEVAGPNLGSPYARFFDEYSIQWQKNPEYNRLFIECQQRYANQLLMARGHIFLNEVYDMLGLKRSKAGQVVGWVMGQGGDNFIDFNMFEIMNSKFIAGYERSILLDFNVDGVIYDKI